MNLEISENEFTKLNLKQQNLVLFKNVIEIKDSFNNYQVTKKVQYWWLSGITLVLGFYYSVMGVKN